ncbi:hypothetical protein BS50DRAFT_580495 [Corynespora cassiicola Philippines]|uniref:Uncharacterized protein n=1 Tax=Corynespora cassiicola Philippines TaxID=1448308 RepID=A0A2T2MZW8_CORCC|nr:hypothetical protein BS50DRAFT_580495 [Corynespora cassiicola Philippines]
MSADTRSQSAKSAGMAMASNSSSDYEHDPAAAEEPTLEEVFSIESLIDRVEEMQRRDQLDTLHKLTLDNSLLQQLILDYQQHWCWTIHLLETTHEAARSLQKALGHCFKEDVAAERRWLEFWGVTREHEKPSEYRGAGWI